MSIISNQLNLSMLSLYSHTKNHFLIVSFLIGKLKFLFLPTKCHFGKPYDFIKYLYFDYISYSILKTQRFTIKIFIVVGIAPSIRIHQVSTMTNITIIVKLVLIFLNSVSKHYTQKYPWPYIKSIKFNKNFSFSLTDISKTRPIHFLIPSFYYPVWDSIYYLAMVNSKNIFSLNLSCLVNSLLCLFIIFFCHNL